jgi:hypothetical protein
VIDDHIVLKPNRAGHFVFYLLSHNEPPPPLPDLKNANTLRTTGRKKRFQQTAVSSYLRIYLKFLDPPIHQHTPFISIPQAATTTAFLHLSQPQHA